MLIWMGRIATGVYTVGYFVYWGAVSWRLWQEPEVDFWQWSEQIAWESLYALAWPFLIF